LNGDAGRVNTSTFSQFSVPEAMQRSRFHRHHAIAADDERRPLEFDRHRERKRHRLRRQTLDPQLDLRFMVGLD
jgi:hypothetical protein